MKEKTVDTEGHRVKVGLDQHKSISSSSSAKVGTSSPNSTIISPTQSKANSTTGKGPFLAPPALNNSTPTSNNFDDDYNEWDISLGDLIIDLDADIEREGDKSLTVVLEKNETPNSLIDSASSSTTPSDQKLFLDLSDSVSVMSSNFKSNRLSSISSSGNSASAHSNNTTATLSPTSANKNILPTSPNAATSTNGGNVGHIHHFHHGHNQRNNFSPTTPTPIIPPNNNSAVKNAAALIEHHATVDKGLKMKIKRKNIGGKNSETKHEIVSSDISPQACKPYISFDHNSNSMPSVAPSTVSSPIIGLNSTVLNSPNSVITANAEGVLSPIGDLSTSKSSKHSNKNKSGHRDKKDKSKQDKDRISLPVSVGSIKPKLSAEDNAVAAVSPPSSGQSIVPNLTLKYSALSPTVIIKSDEANKNPLNQLAKTEDNISETKETGTSTSVATITEPDCLGPCEPGTSVTLGGIVWQETEGGVLVVNVTWRGKTYVGTLLDCTKHDWAPPRFCESPTSDIESKSIKNTRGKRARTNFVADNPIDTRSVTSKLRNGKGRRTTNSGFVPPSPAKSDSSVNSSKRKGRPSDLDLTSVDDSIKRNRISKLDLPDGQLQQQPQQPQQQQPPLPPTSPVLIECPEPNCSKKYKHINGLKYHQSHAHFGSSYNINESQDIDSNAADSAALNSAKGDGSDVEYMDDTPNMLDSPNKDADITDKFNSDTVNDSNEKEQFEKIRTDSAVSITSNDNNNKNNTQNNNSQATDSKILPNCANELIVSENVNSVPILINNDKTGENDNLTVISNNNTTTTTTTTTSLTVNNNNNNSNNNNELLNTNINSNNFTDLVTDNVSSTKKLPDTNSVFAESLNNLSDTNSSREPPVNSALDSIKHLPSDALHLMAPHISKEPTTDVVKQSKLLSSPITTNENQNDSSGTGATGNKKVANNDNIENVASPAYSDISDDTVTNDNANELVHLTSSQPSAPVEVKSDQSTSEIKKPPSSPANFNLNSFPPYFPQSQFLVPGSTVDSKPNESTAKPLIDSKDPIKENPSPENSTLQPNAYPPFPYYNFGSIPPHDSKYSDNIPKVSNSSLNSQTILSPQNANKCDSDNYIKDNNANKQSSKDNSDFNNSKQIPIDELQKLKNRIPNYTFDQGSLYESQKQRYLAENEKDKSKEKMKHSPQLPKNISLKEKDEKEKKNKSQQDEGVKPTMETTGPPPPTNGYYYNPPSFLPHPFSPMSPFESMFRGSAMNQMVMSTFGNPSPSFLHSQMRFPPMGSLDSLSMPRNSPSASVARSTAQLSSSGASSSSTTVKTTSHHLSSYNQNSKLPDRGAILSPTSASASIPSSYSSLITSPSYHKSPNKSEYTGSINQSGGGSHCPPVSLSSDQQQQQRPLMASAPSGMHGPRHHLHSTPHGYPMFDPYSAMIVNHTSNNSVPMHQFTPK